jgi:hypothetical protein
LIYACACIFPFVVLRSQCLAATHMLFRNIC